MDWRKGFMKELKAKREREEEERVRAMMPKEREEWKRKRDRLSGEWKPNGGQKSCSQA